MADLTLSQIEEILVNDENSSDEEMVRFLMSNGLEKESAMLVIWQRDAALRDPIHFKLNPEGVII